MCCLFAWYSVFLGFFLFSSFFCGVGGLLFLVFAVLEGFLLFCFCSFLLYVFLNVNTISDWNRNDFLTTSYTRACIES